VAEAIGRVLAGLFVAPAAAPAIPSLVRDGWTVAVDTSAAGPAPVPPSMASACVATGVSAAAHGCGAAAL